MAGRHCNVQNKGNQFLTCCPIPVALLLLYKPVFPSLLICGCTALSSPFKDLYLKDCLSAYILDLLPTELFILFFRDVYRHLLLFSTGNTETGTTNSLLLSCLIRNTMHPWQPELKNFFHSFHICFLFIQYTTKYDKNNI